MAFDEVPVFATMLADQDMSDAAAAAEQGQYHLVKLTTTEQEVELCDSQGEEVYGVMYDKPAAAGRAAAVVISGICKAMAGGAIL